MFYICIDKIEPGIILHKLKMEIEIIAFDADDTLWDNQSLFHEVEAKLCQLLGSYGEESYISSVLNKIETENMCRYGYGAKAFTLSLIETALTVSKNQVSQICIAQIIEMGKYLLDMPIKLLDGVPETLASLGKKYKLAIAAKGDLLDQQRKLGRSGLDGYFDYVGIVSDKNRIEYDRLACRLRTKPSQILMVSNSFGSDISTALSAGMYAAYIPHQTTWKREVNDEVADDERLFRIDSFSQLCSLLE